MRTRTVTRREAFGRVSAIIGGRPVSDQTGRGGGPGPADPLRLVPRTDLVNTLEFEEQARRKLAPAAYAAIAGSDRLGFDRITLRPRVCVPVLDMDLSVTLFDDVHFAPIIVGPVERQRRFHPDGELATVKGAAAARASVVVSSRSSVPLAELAAGAGTPLWCQIFANDPAAATQIRSAVQAGCRAICVTVGDLPAAGRGEPLPPTAPVDWRLVGTLVRASTVPVIVKGIATPAAAALAIAQGAQGLIVSAYTNELRGNSDSPILTLPSIVDAVAGKIPVLVDGSFRRGTDILKALAFGARAVLIARPVMWGLSAYGAEGVQHVVEMLQTELARYMGMCGKPQPAALDRTLLRVHRRG